MSILNVNKINPVGGGSTITIAGIASVTGNVTATGTITGEHHGDGSNLTGISAGTSLSGSTNNTVCTVTGANAIQGEANLTFDGSNVIHAGSDGRRYSFAGGGSSHYMKFDSTLNGIILNGYGGIAFETNGTNERMRIGSNGDLKFNSGYGSAGTAYGIRAWMQYRGDTNAIIGSGNVSSVTDNATGDFTMNFTTAMPDTNFGVLGTTGYNDTSLNIALTSSGTHAAFTTSAMRFVVCVNYNSSLADERYISVAIVR